MRQALRFSLLVIAGLLLIQAAWIFTMPPFRGSDEFDHVFRASGVAEGHWRLTVDTSDGRGLLTAVPDDVVEAASPQCDARPYTGPHNCFAVERLPNGLVTVSTAAGAYNPGFYFVLGTVGQYFDGAGVDYAMRVATALLSSLGLGCAAFCLVLGRAGRWTRFGFLTSLTPVLVYTTTLPAPNAMEIVAGICLWAALLGFLQAGSPARHARFLLLSATVAASVMATVRYIGPLWLGLIVLTSLAWAGWDNIKTQLMRHRWAISVAVLLVTLALAAGAWWTLTADLIGPTEDRAEYGETVAVALGLQPLVWVFQIIAAFPLRADVAPPGVYVCYLLVVLAFVLVALAKARGRRRLVIAATCLVILCLPVVLTLVTMEAHGIIWQGRYGLPFAAGLTILCGLALDKADVAPREGDRLRLIGCLLLAVAHVVGISHVLAVEHTDPVSRADTAWLAPPVAVVILLTVTAWGIWALSLRGRRPHKVSTMGPYAPVRSQPRERAASDIS